MFSKLCQGKFSEFNPLAIFISLAIHLILLAVLYFSYLRVNKVDTQESEKMVEVSIIKETQSTKINKGNQTQDSKDNNIPQASPKQTTPKKSNTDSQKKNITNTDTDKLARQKEAELEAQKEEAERIRKEKEQAINDMVSSAMKNNNKNSSKNDNKGADDNAINKGKGGQGNSSYSLAGRSIEGGGGLPVRPKTQKAINGRIVIGILVNPEGVVIDAWVDAVGSQIVDKEVRQSAIKAAKETKFSKINETNNQKGKITYIFKIQ